MGYTIEYEDNTPKQLSNWKWMSMLFLLLFLLWTVFYWPQGRAVLVEILMPGLEKAEDAVEVFFSEASAGKSFGDGIKTMLIELTEGLTQ